MKRARKGSGPVSGIGKKKNRFSEAAYRSSDEGSLYRVNEEEDKELRKKYFGDENYDVQTENPADTPENIGDIDINESAGDILNGDISDTADNGGTDIAAEKTNEAVPEESVSDGIAADEPEADIKIYQPKSSQESTENTQEAAITAEEPTASPEAESNNTPEIKVKKRKKIFSKKYAVIFAVSLAVILVGSVLAFSFGGFFGGSGNDVSEEYIEPVDEVTGKVNVLVLGVDNEGLRTDTMIVASFDTDDGTVDILSIPRDTRMYIGSRYQKINAAHAISKKSGKIAGPEGSIEAVTRLTGIPINYYVEFSFKAFRETIDALGGVYYNVPQNMNYEDPTQDLYIHLKQGYQLLDGDKAEQLVRFRSYPEGDIKRVKVQQDFIKELASQKLNAGIIGKLTDLYKTLSKNIKSNFTVSDIAKYASPLMNLKLENLTAYSLPGDYSGSEYEASYWLADMKATKELIETVFGYDTSYTTIDKPIKGAVYGKTADPSKVSEIKTSEQPSASPSPSASASATEKPKNTQSATPKATKKASEKPKASATAKADGKESTKPTESKAAESSKEPEKTEAPAQTQNPKPSFGSSSKDGFVNGGGNSGLSNVHTPPSVSQKPSQSTPKPTQPAASTPAPTKTPAQTGGGFQRPVPNN